ncbi:MAG: hypothetical protein PHS44_00265 [Candidatus Dojkabacteria bacterium]|nr:hypothetical protein [Candidatus Dojkabacteria bacterium]
METHKGKMLDCDKVSALKEALEDSTLPFEGRCGYDESGEQGV